MKPKLILGKRGSGKTTRLLETIKWLRALLIVQNEQTAKAIRCFVLGKKGYNSVDIISCSAYQLAHGREYDIVCVDERSLCLEKGNDWCDLIYRGKIQAVLTETLDDDHFEIEILD